MNSIYNRFKSLNPRVKVVIIATSAFITILLLAALFMSITKNHQQERLNEESSGLSTTVVDENSGETVSPGQTNPELQEVPGAPVIYGITNLMQRGMTYDQTMLVKSVIQGKYAQINNSNTNDKKIETASISKADNIEHTKEESGLDVYTAKFVLNDTQDNLLQIKTNGNNYMQISVGKDVNNLEVIYTSS